MKFHDSFFGIIIKYIQGNGYSFWSNFPYAYIRDFPHDDIMETLTNNNHNFLKCKYDYMPKNGEIYDEYLERKDEIKNKYSSYFVDLYNRIIEQEFCKDQKEIEQYKIDINKKIYAQAEKKVKACQELPKYTYYMSPYDRSYNASRDF